MITLEVGTPIYRDQSLGGLARHLICRVTPKHAFIKYNETAEEKFPREVSENASWINPVKSRDRFCSTHFYLETPELKAKYLRAIHERRFENTKVKDLSDDQLIAIIKIIRGES